MIISDDNIRDSEKNERASRIFLLFKVERYRYVIIKLAELIIEALIAKKTPNNPISIRPVIVNLTRAEKGVIIAQPGNKSLALRSTAQTKNSSFKNRL